MAGSPHVPPPHPVVERLVDNHRQFLSFLERRVGDRTLAEDILQQAFVRGIERLDSLRDEESATAWFYRVLRNAIVDHHRRRAGSSRALGALGRELEHATAAPAEFADEACRCIDRLSAMLPPDQADALEQIDVRGVAVKDYAARRGISANLAAVRVFRARRALRSRIEESCGTCAEHGCRDCTCGGGLS